MSDNGIFRKKKGFTISGNTLVRDKSLSLKAKGLYLLISSYITYEELNLTKAFIYSLCIEKEKAFESVWQELKLNGYLKVYLKPSSKGWSSEYELLDEPKEGAHTFYLSAKGEISCTNIDREQSREKKNNENNALPEKGSNAQGSNVEGTNVKGGDNIRLLNNTKNNNNIISHSFIQEQERTNDRELKSIVEDEIYNNEGIPYVYNKDICKMTEAIQHICEWEIYHKNGFFKINGEKNIFKQETFNLAVEALIEMACETEIKTYNKRRVSYKNVIDKINQTIKGESIKSIKNIIESAVDDYIIRASSGEEIQYPRNYLKSCIMESFDTYQIKLQSLINRTIYSEMM